MAFCPYLRWQTSARIAVGTLLAVLISTGLIIKLMQASPTAPSAQANIYGYLALDCAFGNRGKSDYYYFVGQDPRQLERPHFMGTNVWDERKVTNKQYVTCTIHNDGLVPTYNVALAFAFKVTAPVPTPRASFADLTDVATIMIPRVPSGGTFVLRFFDELPGKDYWFAPLARCSLDTPGVPGSRQECQLPRSAVHAAQPFAGDMYYLLHYRSRTNCTGLVPPLAGDQHECGRPEKRGPH
jgi:hypothetical protein